MDKLEGFIVGAPVLLFSMVAHEYAHGYAAQKQGDDTAYRLGRLTWNPLRHIDPFMTILLPIVTYFGSGGQMAFGGAKPVPVDPRKYRNLKRGDIIVSMAGIVANLLLAVLSVLLFVLFGALGQQAPGANETFAILQSMMSDGIRFNLMLALFNLMPIPPLDGSHVMKYLLPPSWSMRYQQVGMYGMLILVFMLATGVGQDFLRFWLSPIYAFYRMIAPVVQPFALQSSILGA